MHKPVLLIVDDEPEIGEFAAFSAENVGYAVVSTTNGKAFQNAYLTQSPDLILMDVAMPDIDAIGLLEWLYDAGNQTPIILMSGYGDYMLSWAHTQGSDMGMPVIGTLSKPFSLEELDTILSENLENPKV